MENMPSQPSPTMTPPPSNYPLPQDNSTLLYNPSNWAFYSFFLTPFVPAIFYKRNCRMLGKPEEGKKVMMQVFGTFLLLMAIIFFVGGGSLLGLIFSILWIIQFSKLGKTQKPAYDERKQNNPTAPRPKEWTVVVPAIVILVGLGILTAIGDSMANSSSLYY